MQIQRQNVNKHDADNKNDSWNLFFFSIYAFAILWPKNINDWQVNNLE